LIAAIFLSGSALAETTSTPISSQIAAAAKAVKVNSKVKKLAPRVCPRPEDDECRAWCCTCGAKIKPGRRLKGLRWQPTFAATLSANSYSLQWQTGHDR